jgi:hypothetical protein
MNSVLAVCPSSDLHCSCLIIADRNRFVHAFAHEPLPFLLPSNHSYRARRPRAAGQTYIYVEGKAEIEKPADMMTLRFDLVGRAPQQPKANEDVQAKAN